MYNDNNTENTESLPFSNDNIVSFEFFDESCRVFQENGYHFHISRNVLHKFMTNLKFSHNVKFNGLLKVLPSWFEQLEFWKNALLDTTSVFIHGVWDSVSLSTLVGCFPRLIKLRLTYWRCETLIPTLKLLKCNDIVIDLRGLGEEIEDKTVEDVYDLKADTFELVNSLPENLSSLFLIFGEYFQVDQFKVIQNILYSKMFVDGKQCAQVVMLFNGEINCIRYELVNPRGRLKRFRFIEAEPCQIVSYHSHLNMYRPKKNLDAFNIFYKTYKDVSFVIGARIIVADSDGTCLMDDTEYPVVDCTTPVKLETSHALRNLHHEVDRFIENPATGRENLPHDELFYTVPGPVRFKCCHIKNFKSRFSQLKGLKFSYGIPVFKRARYLSVLWEKANHLLSQSERVSDIVYFPKHVELHFDNGFISRPDVDETYILRLVYASSRLTVHSTSNERLAIEAITLNEHLKFVESIEFRGKWWGRLIYQFVLRRPACLKKFTSVCFQGQRTALADLWHHHRQQHGSYISEQLSELSFDARDCRLDNLYDALRALFDDQKPDAPAPNNYTKLFLIVAKVCGPNVNDIRRFSFEKVITIIEHFTKPGSVISVAIFNALKVEDRKPYNYFGDETLVNGPLQMKCIGTTIVPQIHYKCGITEPDFVLKLYYSVYNKRSWYFAIPFDCQ